MTRVVFVSHTNAPGGAELSLARYLQLTRRPDDTHLVTLEGGGVWDRVDPDLIDAPSRLMGPARQLAWLRATLRRLQPDIVVSNGMRIGPYVVLARPRSSRHVYWLHDGLGSDSAMSPFANLLTRRMVFPDVSRFIVNSEWTRGTLLAVRPAAVSLVSYPLCALPAGGMVRSLPDPVIPLLYLGRISPWKAPHVAVEAMERLVADHGDRYTLTIAGSSHFGEDEYAQRLRDLIEGSAVAGRVRTLGFVGDVAGLLAEHALLLHCSTTPEPFGRVIVEGLSAGVPVIATGVGAPADIIDSDVNGYLYTPGDADDLAQRIDEACSTNAHYERLSRGALSSAATYAEGPIVAALDAFLGTRS